MCVGMSLSHGARVRYRLQGDDMGDQVPSVGRVVHFVNGDQHCAAIITDPSFVVAEGPPGNTALVVFPPMEQAFRTIAFYDESGAPATWHWPERV